MNSRIVFEADDGGVSIVVPTGEVSIEELIARVVPAGASYRVVDESEIPSDRSDRDSWTWAQFQ